MKRINKIYLIAIVCFVIFSIQSCSKDFLDVPPQGQQPEEQTFQTQDDAIKAVNAIYANLRSFSLVAFGAIAVESMGSDEVEKGSTPGDATFFNNFKNFTYTATEGQVYGFWNGLYQNINLCNQVLDRVPAIEMDEALKARLLAEAKFIRAYDYFRLVRAYGGVPLRLSINDEVNLPRNTAEEVWAQIEVDLTEVTEILPQSYESSQVGRVTKGAAIALHAKVAMYQKKWNDVFTYTNTVIGMGYSLFPDFEGLFRVPNENSSESIFEIQAARIPGNTEASNSQYSQVQGVRGVPWGGWGLNIPSQALDEAFEEGDPRRDATILFRGETTPQGDKVPDNADNPRYNQKAYVPSSYFVSGYTEGADQNIRVIRYAEVLLMNAEAANELGNTAQALTSLNAVRARARGNNPNILPNIVTSDQQALREAIWHERHVELAMEFDRYFDVIRQGRAPQIFGPRGFVAGKNELMPIPSDEIDLSGGTLTQNPGY